MKKLLLAATVAGLVAATGAAEAADLGPSPYYSPVRVYNWGGFYAGLNVGYHWGEITSSNLEPSGVAGGGQVGYNWQNNHFVFGLETDIQASSADDTFAPYKFSNPWFGTLRARAGYSFDNVLLYGTFGLAYGDVEGERNSLDETKTETGWTAGVGLEMGFAPNWSAKVEYLYMDLGSRSFSITGADNGFQANLLRLGVNYHF